MRILNCLLTFLFIYSSAFAQNPYPTTPVVLENNGVYGKLEIAFDMVNLPTSVNPYDPDQIKVEVLFQNGFASLAGHAFYYQDFTFNAGLPCDRQGSTVDHDLDGQVGRETRRMDELDFLTPSITSYPWRVRVAPNVVGTWDYRIYVWYNGVPVGQSPLYQVEIARSDNPGFIVRHIDEDPLKKGFVRTTGEGFFPTGANLDFYLEPYCKSVWDDLYVGGVNQIAQYRGNYARLLMSADEWRTEHQNGFIFNVEGGIVNPGGPSTPSDGILGNYDRRQNIAFLLDNLIDMGATKNVNFQLCLMTYAELKGDNWDHHVFNTLPSLSSSAYDFYTDLDAKRFFKRKLRYILSRWGYATNIMAWELLAELDLTYLDFLPVTDFDGLATLDVDIKNWVYEMSDYMESLDHDHMVALSRGADWHYDSPTSTLTQISNLPNIDYTQNHTYKTANGYSGLHLDRHRAQRFRSFTNGRPTFAGEFGESSPSYDINGRNFDRAPDYENYYCRNDFHNNIWASSFSGIDGTATTWWWWIFDYAWPYENVVHYGNVNHFEPLRKLLDQIDFANGRFDAISNRGLASTGVLAPLGLDNAECNTLSGPLYSNESYHNFAIPSPSEYEVGIATFPHNSQESADDKLLAFGLKTDWNIYGWLQKRDNWWHNLPHALGPNPFDFCNWDAATAQTCSASFIQDNAFKAQFQNVCEGEYIIDYYSTYPHRSTVSGAPRNNSNGGEIPAFQRRFFTTDRSLNVKLPGFRPLDNTQLNPDTTSIYAPDYGYRISKIEAENFQSAYIGQYVSSQDVDLTGDIETFYRFSGATKMFFKGANDGLMHQHYFDPGLNQWVHTMMNNNQVPSEMVTGSIAAEHGMESSVFYRGMNGKMSHYYYVTGQGWIFDCLPANCNLANPAEAIDQNSEMAAAGGQVFYKGSSDQKMQLYYFDNNVWNHKYLNNNVVGEKIIAGDIKTPIGAYSNTDLVFFVNELGELCLYSRNSGNPGDNWTYRVLNTSAPLTAAQMPVGNICPIFLSYTGLPADQRLYCFYIGADGDIHYLVNQSILAPNQPYPVNSVWQHENLNGGGLLDEKADLASELNWDADPSARVLYYWGADGYMHRYYWDHQLWSHSAIVPCEAHNFPESDNGVYARDFRILNDHFVYKGTDLRMRVLWNAKNCEKCSEQRPYRTSVSPDVPGAKEQKENEAFRKKVEFATEEIYATVYPNPCVDKLNFICDHRSGGDMKVVLVNTFGSVLVSERIKSGEKRTINVEDYVRGVYFLQFFDGQGKMLSSQKIIFN
jgi:hypothetical protein